MWLINALKAPVSLDIHSPMDLVFQCFVKLGLRYICVLRDGQYAGLVHKKTFVKYVNELEGVRPTWKGNMWVIRGDKGIYKGYFSLSNRFFMVVCNIYAQGGRCPEFSFRVHFSLLLDLKKRSTFLFIASGRSASLWISLPIHHFCKQACLGLVQRFSYITVMMWQLFVLKLVITRIRYRAE